MTNANYNFIMDIISSKNIKLSKSENIIVDRIKDINVDFSHININDLSEILKVSNSTITRFAQKLGFDGFSELKFDISKKPRRTKSLSQEIYINFIDSIEAFD